MSWTSVVIIVYLSMFLDNLLLTIVVPIIPDYLFRQDSVQSSHFHSGNKSVTEAAGVEGGRVGALLSSKALLQLVANPIVGHLARFTGYNIPLFFGSVSLLASSLMFAIGEGYTPLLLARSLQGIASSCIGVAGMSVVACSEYESEEKRCKIMGIVLGSVALGVLLGYPTGGFLYSTLGKTAPFIFVTILAVINLGIQLKKLDLHFRNQIKENDTSFKSLISEPIILLSAGAICVSSSAMAILEPCLPLWLMDNIKPEKWELGTVFIPDSVGYLIGTNCFGVIAYKVGRWRISIASMILLGISASTVPLAKSVMGLAMPHFCLGLSVGVVDAALVPLLATLVEKRKAHYSTVYSFQQTAVSLAYALGPMIGGELVQQIGFPWLMRMVGIINILYSPLLLLLLENPDNQEDEYLDDGQQVNYRTTEKVPLSEYKRMEQ